MLDSFQLGSEELGSEELGSEGVMEGMGLEAMEAGFGEEFGFGVTDTHFERLNNKGRARAITRND